MEMTPGPEPVPRLPEYLSDFVSANMPPPEGQAVIAIRRSDTVRCKYEVLTAYYDPRWHFDDPWRTLDNVAATDSGKPILGWMNGLRWLQTNI